MVDFVNGQVIIIQSNFWIFFTIFKILNGEDCYFFSNLTVT